MVVRRDHFDYEMLMVVAGFLAGYTENTLMAYQQDLRIFVSWCRNRELPLLEVRRAHIELFARFQEAAGYGQSDDRTTVVDGGQFLPLRGGGADWPVAGGECETTQGATRVDHDRFGS